MSRCTCSPMCPRCGDGPCDCTCTKEEVAAYKAKIAADRLAPIEARGAVTDEYAIAADAVCKARNEWSEKHEERWLETDENHPDDFIGRAVVDALRARESAPAIERATAEELELATRAAFFGWQHASWEWPLVAGAIVEASADWRCLDVAPLEAALSQPTRAAGEPMDVGTEYYETLPILEEDGRITCPHHPTWCCLKRAHTSDQCISTGAA